jgi:hypothetical protein
MFKRKTTGLMGIFYRFSGTSKSDTLKSYICLLTAILVISTLGSTPISTKVKHKFSLSASSSFIFRPHALDNLNKEKYALLDKDDFTIENCQVFHKAFSLDSSKLLIYPLGSHCGFFLDIGKSSVYISFFASLPLRSPPLFS